MAYLGFTDRGGIYFGIVGLLFAAFAIFRTQTLLQWLSYNRRTTFSRLELMVIRAPATLAMIGLLVGFAATFINRIR